jgi:hypothetical protein
LSYGVTQSGGFPVADLSGDEGHGACADGIVESFLDTHKFRGLKDFAKFQICLKGFFLEAEEGSVSHGHHLLRPFLSSIIDLKVQLDAEVALVKRRAGRGMREIVTCRLPAFFTVDLMEDEPRLQKFEDSRYAQSKAIETLHYGDYGEKVRTIVTRNFPPRPDPRGCQPPTVTRKPLKG